MTNLDPLATNRARWDALAAVHGHDSYYDTASLLAGEDSLCEEEQAAITQSVGSADGLDVLHVQCHIGFDTISLARRGARVTGVDFSPASLAKAAALADQAGVQARWVQADATHMPAALHASFDLAYATMGVICWIEDLSAWMRSVAAVLRPGGRLILIDGHPLMNMVADQPPFSLDFPYAFDGAHRFDEDGSYADPDAKLAATKSVEYTHSLGEIVTAAIQAGLRLDALTEHLEATHATRPHILTREADGRLRLRVDSQPLPILFTLLATRSAPAS